MMFCEIVKLIKIFKHLSRCGILVPYHYPSRAEFKTMYSDPLSSTSHHHAPQMKANRLYMLYRKARVMTIHWAEWSHDHREGARRRRIALVMGQLAVLRKRFYLWRRWTTNVIKVLIKVKNAAVALSTQ